MSDNWQTTDTQLDFTGTKIVLPGEPIPMEIDSAIETLHRIKEQEQQEFDVRETILGAPWDAAVAVYRAMQHIYGVVLSRSIETWFGEIRPDLLTVQTDAAGGVIQVPIGRVQLPNIANPVYVSLQPTGVILSGTVTRKDRTLLVQIVDKAKELLSTNSVYRGKAVRFQVTDQGEMQITEQPTFINLDLVIESMMIHTKETQAQIATNIFSPLRNTAACRRHHIPLKRGILLEGKYGTGKSLTAVVTAKVATDNGWTFIMLNRAQGLKAAIEFARRYQPCVIFAEDIDRAADRSDEQVNDLVNTLDGVIGKDSEIMVVLTTNFIERIDQALLRPGRFDAVISIQPPDSETVIRLIEAFGGWLLEPGIDLTEVSNLLAGAIPATIREVVERAKLAMLMEDRELLNSEDLMTAALGMRRHQALLEPPAAELTPSEMFAKGFLGLMGQQMGMETDWLGEQFGGTRFEIERQAIRTRDVLDKVASFARGAGAAAQIAAKEAGEANKKLNGLTKSF